MAALYDTELIGLLDRSVPERELTRRLYTSFRHMVRQGVPCCHASDQSFRTSFGRRYQCLVFFYRRDAEHITAATVAAAAKAITWCDQRLSYTVNFVDINATNSGPAE